MARFPLPHTRPLRVTPPRMEQSCCVVWELPHGATPPTSRAASPHDVALRPPPSWRSPLNCVDTVHPTCTTTVKCDCVPHLPLPHGAVPSATCATFLPLSPDSSLLISSFPLPSSLFSSSLIPHSFLPIPLPSSLFPLPSLPIPLFLFPHPSPKAFCLLPLFFLSIFSQTSLSQTLLSAPHPFMIRPLPFSGRIFRSVGVCRSISCGSRLSQDPETALFRHFLMAVRAADPMWL